MTRRLERAMRHPVRKIRDTPSAGTSSPGRHSRATSSASWMPPPARRRVIEINGDPHRLDLEPRWIRAARERDIPFVVSSDAHSTAALANFRWGVAMARRGWVRRARC